MTTDEEITYLEAQLDNVRTKIKKIFHLKSMEEGSSSSRFSTQYTDLEDLEKSEHKLKARLMTLKAYKS